jgi:hypothetical protein
VTYAPLDTVPTRAYPVFIGTFIVTMMISGLVVLGPAPVVIIGGAMSIAFIAWLLTTYRKPADPERVMPLYLLTIAAQLVHVTEEYLMMFPPRFSELFSLEMVVSSQIFAVAIYGVATIIYLLAGAGLYARNPAANYVVWFVIIGPGLINSVAHLAFLPLSGSWYFPGIITVVLPTVMSLLLHRRLLVDYGSKSKG